MSDAGTSGFEDPAFPDLVRDQEQFKSLFIRRFQGYGKNAPAMEPCRCDRIGKGRDLAGRDVVPEPGPGRVEVTPVPCKGKRLFLSLRGFYAIADIRAATTPRSSRQG